MAMNINQISNGKEIVDEIKSMAKEIKAIKEELNKIKEKIKDK